MYKWKVDGLDMDEPVFIETEGKTTLEAIRKASDLANEMGLDWDNIEYVI